MIRALRQTSDGRVVRRVLSGQGEAFGVLIERYGRAAHAVAHALSPAPSDTDDVVQEAFIRAYQKLDTLEQPNLFGPWLITITRNVALRARERARGTLPLEDAPAAAVAVSQEPDRHELRRIVREAVENLEDEPREVLMLHYFGGLPLSQVAELLEISPVAARKRLQRARAALGTRLLKQLGHEAQDVLELNARRRKSLLSGVLAAGAAWRGVAHAAGAQAAAAPAGILAVGMLAKGAGIVLALGAIGGLLVVSDMAEGWRDAPVAQQTSLSGPGQNQEAEAEPAESLRPDADTPGAGMDLPTGPCSVSTWLKTDDDQPVAGATAVLERVTWEQHDLPPAVTNMWTATSDDLGRVVFAGLPAGSYSMIAFTDTLAGAESFAPSARAPEAEDQETLMMPLVSMRGAVTDGAGESLAGAVLYPFAHDAFPREQFDHATVAATRALTNDSGTFEFARLWPGKMRFYIVANGYPPYESDWTSTTAPARFTLPGGGAVQGTLLIEGTETGAEGVEVHLRKSWRIRHKTVTGAGGKFSLENLSPGSYSISIEDAALVMMREAEVVVEAGQVHSPTLYASEGGMVMGRVTNADTGEGIGGLVVAARGNKEREAVTAGDGSFLLTGVYPGSNSIAVAGTADNTRRNYPGGAPGFEDANMHRQVHVSAAETLEGVDFSLRPALVVRGQVLSSDGTPAPGATIHLLNTQCPPDSRFGINDNIDSEARFVLDQVPRDCTFDLLARGNGMMSEPVAVSLESAGTPLELRLTVPAQGRLSGRVLAPDGKLLPNAQVMLEYEDGLRIDAEAEEGIVTFENLPPGPLEYSIMYEHDNAGYWHVCTKSPLELKTGEHRENVEFVCGARGELSIQGQVVRPDGRPVRNALVRLHGEPQQTTTDRDGRFTLEGLHEGQTYWVRAEFKGYSPGQRQGVPADTDNLVLQLETLARIRGFVVDAAGAPVQASLRLFSLSMETNEIPETVSDESGAFTFENVVTGSGRIEVTAREYAQKTLTYGALLSGEQREIRIELAAPALVAGVVLDPEGAPLAEVDISGNHETPVTAQRTGTDGRFVLANVEAGLPLHLQFRHTVYGHLPLTVVPGEPGSDQLRVQMISPPVLEVIATIDGAPLENFTVNARCINPPSGQLISGSSNDATGRFESNEVFTGVWSVSVNRTEQLVSSVRILASMQQEVELESGKTTTVRAAFETGSASLRCRLLDWEPGSHSVFASINMAGDGTAYRAKVSGNDLIFDDVPSGDHLLLLNFSGEGWFVLRRNVNIREGEENYMEIVVNGGASALITRAPGARENVFVTLNQGEAPVAIDFLRAPGEWSDEDVYTASIVASGQAQLPYLKPGEYWMNINRIPETSDGGAEARLEVRQINIAPGNNSIVID